MVTSNSRVIIHDNIIMILSIAKGRIGYILHLHAPKPQPAVRMTAAASIICPFTLKPIPDISRENLAVIYNSSPFTDAINECGHLCSLAGIISYLHNGMQPTPMCPVCQACQIGAVCDADASSFMTGKSNSTNTNNSKSTSEGRLVSFKYGAISYHLWVPTSSPSSLQSTSNKVFDKEGNALERIAQVMGMDVQNGLKV